MNDPTFVAAIKMYDAFNSLTGLNSYRVWLLSVLWNCPLLKAHLDSP